MFLFKRNGKFYLDCFDETENRTRRISTHAKRKDEALKFLSEFKERLSNLQKPPLISLSRFAESYGEYVKSRHSTNYFLTVERSLKALMNFAGDVPLKDAHRRLLEDFFDSVSEKSKNTANLYHRTLAAAFSKAVEWNYLSENPLKKIKLSKVPKKLPVFIIETALISIFERTKKPDMKDLFTLAYHTGLGLSELLNLEWQAVNLVERIIKVSNEGLHFHSLRHSTASTMVRRGVPIAAVKEVLGHTDIKTTMVYNHVRREDLANAVKMLEPTN